MASTLMPKDGTAKACRTSAEVTWSRTTLLTGTTISLSAAEQARLVGLQVLGLGDHVRIELEAAALIGRILVAPVPGIAGRLHHDVGRRRHQLLAQEAEGGDRDGHEDQHRDDGPGHLEQGVVGGLRRGRVLVLVEAHHDHEEQRQHEQADRCDQPHEIGVKIGHALPNSVTISCMPISQGEGMPAAAHASLTPNTSATAAAKRAVADRSPEVSIRIGVPKLLRYDGRGHESNGDGAGVRKAVPGLRHHL